MQTTSRRDHPGLFKSFSIIDLGRLKVFLLIFTILIAPSHASHTQTIEQTLDVTITCTRCTITDTLTQDVSSDGTKSFSQSREEATLTRTGSLKDTESKLSCRRRFRTRSPQCVHVFVLPRRCQRYPIHSRTIYPKTILAPLHRPSGSDTPTLSRNTRSKRPTDEESLTPSITLTNASKNADSSMTVRCMPRLVLLRHSPRTSPTR